MLFRSRNLFAGNMLRHPLFLDLRKDVDFRVVGKLKNTDKIMNDSLWIGVYPGMSEEKINYCLNKILEFMGVAR